MQSFFKVSVLVMFFLPSTFTASFAQVNWTKDPNNPVISGEAAGTWNRHVFMPNVLYNPDSSRYEMWFSACVGLNANDWRPYRIGFATSDNVIDWTMHPTAVLTPSPGEWDQFTVEQQFVIRENGQYRMWYGGTLPDFDNAGIGYANSPDGIHWTKDTLNSPLIGAGTDAWEELGLSTCFIMPVQDGYRMWYTAWETNIETSSVGYATSADGIHWQKDTLNNPVFEKGNTGQWDSQGVGWAQVLLIEDKYYMWFEGSNGTNRRIGLATSDDGIDWIKYNDPETNSTMYADSDPVLSPSAGQWDGTYIETGSVKLIDDTLHLWYGGGRSPTGTYLWRIGHATMPLDSLLEWVSGIEDYDNTNIPEGFSLSQNYPNPFNPSTTIEFSLPISEFVELKIYNILGKDVATIVSNKLNSGNHTYQFDGKNLASGVYYYQLVAGDYREVKKMILLR